MKMNKFLFFPFFVLLLITSCAGENEFLIETSEGNITVELSDETPKHKKNFNKLVKQKFFDDLLFHRVMNNFMIQGADPESKTAKPGAMLGKGSPGYTIPAELGGLHFRGALSSARQGDRVNPKKASNGSQFFIVHGRKNISDAELDRFEKALGRPYTPEERNRYKTEGGYPSLDGKYSVFGKVTAGMEVVDKIAKVPVDKRARPIKDIKMKITPVQ